MAQVTGTMISGKHALPSWRNSIGRLEDGADLHLGDFGIGDAEAHAAVTHHGVDLVQLVARAVEFGRIDAEGLGELWRARSRSAARTRAAAGRAGGWSPGRSPMTSRVAFMSA